MQRVFCNKCGREVKSGEEYVRHKYARGYGSKFDTDSFEYDLCSECADQEDGERIEKYEISPRTSDFYQYSGEN